MDQQDLTDQRAAHIAYRGPWFDSPFFEQLLEASPAEMSQQPQRVQSTPALSRTASRAPSRSGRGAPPLALPWGNCPLERKRSVLEWRPELVEPGKVGKCMADGDITFPGGGEFGPKWHQAAMQENHQNNFDDFIAVAEDLIARKVTSPRHLGIVGGSNGGLLVGACFTQRPELFNAVVCQVPLLDMKRYNKLLAGASWMAEYGNPDTEDWDNFMSAWSPYQNLDQDTDYPRVFFFTSTRDDRVHPGHARKMVAKMEDMGQPVYYYENTEGGHAGAANLNQRAYMWALTYSYLWKMLK